MLQSSTSRQSVFVELEMLLVAFSYTIYSLLHCGVADYPDSYHAQHTRLYLNLTFDILLSL